MIHAFLGWRERPQTMRWKPARSQESCTLLHALCLAYNVTFRREKRNFLSLLQYGAWQKHTAKNRWWENYRWPKLDFVSDFTSEKNHLSTSSLRFISIGANKMELRLGFVSILTSGGGLFAGKCINIDVWIGLSHWNAFKVVRNSFPFSITTELYERFTRL